MHGGHPGTWEALSSPPTNMGMGSPFRNLQAPEVRVPLPTERNTDDWAVSLSEGNEVMREGRQGVGAPHSTREAGEPIRRTLWREGGAGTWNC